MVLKLEQFNIEDIASRNTFRVLRYLILNPNAGFGLSELSELLGISKSNVFRALKALRQHNLVVEQKKLRKKTYRINSEMRLNQYFWNIFMEEKQRNIPSDVKNAIDLLFDSVKDDVSVFIVFGSVAQGLATPKSDIDVLVVGKGIKEKRFDFLPHRFEIHEYEWEDIEKLSDFVVLEALTGGIIYKGNLFNQAAKITSFSRAYLIYRLEKAKEFLTKARKSKG
jgi:predicted nucleotidyltransferase/biotin operon repressor